MCGFTRVGWSPNPGNPWLLRLGGEWSRKQSKSILSGHHYEPPGSPVTGPWRVDLYQHRHKVASCLVVQRFEPEFLQHLFRVLADLGCRGK
jgi:hypothetical protein